MADFTVLSWNVRGLNSAIKRSLVHKYIQQHNLKICILQETHLIGARIMGLKRAWVSDHYHTSYSNYARGVSVLVYRSLSFQLVDIKTDPGGRYVLVHALIAGSPYIIVGVYLPPPSDITLLHTLMQTVIQYDVSKVLVVGDFNLVMSNELDRLRPSPSTGSGLSQWVSSFHMTDLWRHFHPSDTQFTCLSTTFRTLSLIDMAFASSDLLRETVSTDSLLRHLGSCSIAGYGLGGPSRRHEIVEIIQILDFGPRDLRGDAGETVHLLVEQCGLIWTAYNVGHI